MQTKIGTMSHIKRDDPDRATVIRRSARRGERLAERSVMSAANDNDHQGPWPLIPFPESPYPSVLLEDVTNPQRLSWKDKLITLSYVVATSIAVFGWLYVLSLAIVSSVVWILS